MFTCQTKRIAFWLGTLSVAPDVEDICRRWDVQRATGYRWRRFALDMGLPPRDTGNHPRTHYQHAVGTDMTRGGA